jgi:putative peptide zinc metalloprotease protein
MSVERPSFHESWYRIAALKPRLLTSVQIYRQHFRGQMWYVLENPANNEFSRISIDAYRFVGMLDGRRTVADVWNKCNELYADSAPTQGEVIGLLGQLYNSNLLYAELPADAQSLFNRYHSRIRRQVRGFFSNLLFVRIPVFDPDWFLDKWVSIFGWLFGWFGLLVWLMLISAGLYFVAGNIKELFVLSSSILAPGNFLLLYCSALIIKILHEFGHAFACKRFGRKAGSGGQVHVMGVMFLVFVPLPFVDASSAWAFRKKWHRIVVGLAGIMVELACAAVAAIIWANTSSGTLHSLAYNIIFIASVSTILFNANPLLRFDGYYVLSDLLEIPNFGQRSKNYLYYLVKKYIWGLKSEQNPANSAGEKFWFILYGPVSTVYRIFICVRVLFFLNSRLPAELVILVPLLAASAVLAWVIVPIWKFISYLATSNQLYRNRYRAMATTLAGLAVIVTGVGIIPAPDYCTVEGFAEPRDMRVVYAESSGFVEDFLSSGQYVSSLEPVLVKSKNPELDSQKKSLLAWLDALQARRRLAQTGEEAVVQIIDEQISALKQQMDRVDDELSKLNVTALMRGIWISPEIEKTKGAYLERGTTLGIVANLDDMLVRATVGQDVARILQQAFEQLEIRVKGRPEVMFKGSIEQIYPAGQQVLPSQSLGYSAGGQVATQDKEGVKALENFFEIRIKPESNNASRLLCGQRVLARIQIPSKPLAQQWWLFLRQLFQRRFYI